MTFEFHPSIFYEKDAKGRVIEIFGTEVEVYKALVESMNWQAEFIEPPRGELFSIDDFTKLHVNSGRKKRPLG